MAVPGGDRGQALAIARAIREAGRTVALTGAGVSTERGIPDFRSDHGIWANADPMEVGSLAGFRENPARFYDFWGRIFDSIGDVGPASAHVMLAGLEARGIVTDVVTQNIDGLHQAAGARRVIEVHGNWHQARCLRCGHTEPTMDVVELVRKGHSPRCEACGGLLKPGVILFGEPLGKAFDLAEQAVRGADLLLVLGSSLSVAPVEGLVPLAQEHGAKIAIINRDPTHHDRDADHVAHLELKEAVDVIARELELPG